MLAAPWSPRTMASAMRMRYISEEDVPGFFGWRPVSPSEAAVPTWHPNVICYVKSHPLSHYVINSNKPVFKPVFDSQPI
jgi:hypothetical protein